MRASLTIGAARDIAAQLRQLMAGLCRDCVLQVGARQFRFTEVEAYYRGPNHQDPFVHGHPLQREWARFYFHRRGDSYVGGSYKGLDITFGDGQTSGGILIRGLAPLPEHGAEPDNSVIDGPSRCVDALLAAAGHGHVRDLDGAIGEQTIFAHDGFMRVTATPRPDPATPRYTARVGLTLKRYTAGAHKERYLLMPYRCLTRPRAIKKGRLHLLIALHQSGRDQATIRQLTGSPAAAIRRTIDAYEQARASGDGFQPYIDRTLRSADLTRLHGIWATHFG